MNTPQTADLILETRWIIPVEPAGITLEHHSVVIRDGVILDILPIAQARARYIATTTRDLSEHILLPGLVNTHTHAAMTLLRGYADDLPLMRWLQEAIWPAEHKLVSDQFVYDGSFLAAAEMLLGGITTCSDMYFFPDAAARAFSETGMRAVLGMTVMEFANAYANDADDYLHKGLEARDKWKDDPLLTFALAPHAPYTVSDACFEKIGILAEELDVSIHIHLHETHQETLESQAKYGMRPLQRLQNLGLAGPNLLAIHAVHMTEHELDTMAACNIAVSHNPTSNMKLANGIAPVAGMLARNITLGLGTDGAASNNRLDLFQEMRHAALLAKGSSKDASILPAHTALHLATLGGAQALGLSERIGSIKRGKDADLCAISLASPLNTPCYDIASHLVYVAGRESVSDVWVRGKPVVHANRLLHTSNTELLRISRLWQNAAKR